MDNGKTFTLKAKVGELIYYLQENKVHSAPVLDITVNIFKDRNIALYRTCHNTGLREEFIFLSRAALASSLLHDPEEKLTD